MNIRQTLLFSIVATAVLLTSSGVFALNTGAVSAGAFHPESNADVPYIFNYGVYFGNSDSSSSHNVSANLGLYNGAAQTVTFMGSNNGGTLSCTVYVVDVSSLNSHFYQGSTTVNGSIPLTINIPASLSSSAVISADCTIPPHNANGYAEVWLVK